MAPAVVREAVEADIPAIISLQLTSFRQFPLFYVLYSPIETKPDNARDTVFYWRWRLLLDLLDPDCLILVADLPLSEQPQADDQPTGDENERSKRMR